MALNAVVEPMLMSPSSARNPILDAMLEIGSDDLPSTWIYHLALDVGDYYK